MQSLEQPSMTASKRPETIALHAGWRADLTQALEAA
jgi:hypothetical protein